jgi:tRNA (cytidine/uridine-2'-O-)-methyltransferase
VTGTFRFIAKYDIKGSSGYGMLSLENKWIMFSIILYQPEIPPNTGNIIRLCANTGAHLHLVEPLGFQIDAANVRRAGLDYHEMTHVTLYPDWQSFCVVNEHRCLWAFSSRGTKHYCEGEYKPEDGLVFGPETRGLPAQLLADLGPDRVVRLPMCNNSRSLNLSNTVAVALYEALRQNHFHGLA